MTSKFLARVFLSVAGLAVVLGNYWFTYGLWPKSWTSFTLFGVASIVLIALNVAIDKEQEAGRPPKA